MFTEHFASDADIVSDLGRCQSSLHAWGRANQVKFDPGKKSFHIIDRKRPVGDNFRLLGVTFDPRLVMDTACVEIAGQAHSRLRTLLRGRRFFAPAALIRLYKSHILSYVEFATPAVHHAPGFFLGQIDRVQAVFLEKLEISAAVALLNFNLAPLSTRRDVAVMGLLFRIATGCAPSPFNLLIQRSEGVRFPKRLRNPAIQHRLQLRDPIDGTHSNAMERSVLGLVYSFNMLPDHVIGVSSVQLFQRLLQNGVKNAVRRGLDNWESFLRSGVKRMSLASYQDVFC